MWSAAWPARADDTAVQPAGEEAVASGRLRPFGHYLSRPWGHTATLLDDGSLLVYGDGMPVQGEDRQEVQTQALRERHLQAYPSRPDTAPKLWDRARRGWRRLGAAPECPHPERHLHTATLLPGGQVLVAGGLCDRPMPADELAPNRPHTALSLWDPAARAWRQTALTLKDARIFHTATAMRDGSVILAAGATDPGLTPGPGLQVLASVEQVGGGRVRSLPPLATARAKHTATALDGGNLLVAGGLDAQGRPIDSAELWDAQAGAWKPLLPLKAARYGHTAVLLADGRVMVAGGIGADGAVLSSTEVWDPASRTWSDAAPLPLPLHGHAAARLASGKVLVAGGTWITDAAPIPWAWTWNPAGDSWQVAGHTRPDNPSQPGRSSTQITLAPRADGGALVLTPDHVMRWEPGPAGVQTLQPLWHDKPTAAALADGRVLMVGWLEDQGGGQAPVARLWSPATRTWADAGRLNQRGVMRAGLLQLPSGEVLHVGVDGDSELACEAWEPASNRWQACGSAHVQQASHTRVRLGLLPDGRAFAIATYEDVFVFDAGRRAWTAWQPDWGGKGLAFGAPIRAAQPLLALRDPASGQSYGIDAEAGRFRQNETYGDMPPSLLWDARAKLWAYVFQGRRMGGDAQWLPGGCALSTQPLAVFDAASGAVTPLQDPGFGAEPGSVELVVLKDGTVVAAGVPEGAKDAGGGFFQGKATCAGFEPAAVEADYIAGGLAVDPPAAAARAASAAAPVPGWRQRIEAALPSGRSLLAGVAAVLVAGWMFYASTAAARVFIAAAVLAVGLGTLWLQQRTPGSRGATPCKMVGVWSSRHGNAMRRIELKDDGRYAMAAGEASGDRTGGYTGRWAVVGDTMVWHHDQGPGEPDVNALQRDGDTRFTLTEGNGSHTVFELIRAVPSQRCTP